MLEIGIDTVEIERFKKWKSYPRKMLSKILLDTEIDYCLAQEVKSAERFASHFAIKEAFYKAISPVLKEQIPFLKLCKNIELNRSNKIPNLKINWHIFKNIKVPQAVKISITHEKLIAIAVVIIN